MHAVWPPGGTDLILGECPAGNKKPSKKTLNYDGRRHRVRLFTRAQNTHIKAEKRAKMKWHVSRICRVFNSARIITARNRRHALERLGRKNTEWKLQGNYFFVVRGVS